MTEPGLPDPTQQSRWRPLRLLQASMDADIARLTAAGCRFRNEVIQGVGGKQILLEDPSGNLIELFQPNPAEYRAPSSAEAQAH